ncbi:hypothetical protein [Streptomyces torulosus]|uniref:hypothetical protein n=1 Tax=Streptomyces torulosus TaxID=68276 RepID=UPI001472291F|nr:hypothetical protein [Streptomyces torulosus]
MDMLLPAVTGSLTTDREYPGDGRIVLLEHRGKNLVRGAFRFTTHDARQSIGFEFDHSLSSELRIFGHLWDEATERRFDLFRLHLAAFLRDAVERLQCVEELCAASAGARTSDEHVAHAEALWARSRLLLIRDDIEKAARCAVEGAEHAERSAGAPGCHLEAAGRSLARVLDVLHQSGTAQQVRRSLRGT